MDPDHEVADAGEVDHVAEVEGRPRRVALEKVEKKRQHSRARQRIGVGDEGRVVGFALATGVGADADRYGHLAPGHSAFLAVAVVALERAPKRGHLIGGAAVDQIAGDAEAQRARTVGYEERRRKE
jgi:hypothetical protein